MSDTVKWHSIHDGPWWKRWRIRYFGLTTRERAENMESYALLRKQVLEEIAQDEFDFAEIIQEWNRERSPQ